MKGIQYVAVIVLLVIMAWVGHANAFWGFGRGDALKVENGQAVIPVEDVSDGEAHYYNYDVGGTEVKFFVLKSSDGVIRAAFDACDVCYLEKKGYSQEGEFMVCNNCGQKFHSSRINEVRGGCNPSPLNRVVADGQVLIQVSDIQEGLRYF